MPEACRPVSRIWQPDQLHDRGRGRDQRPAERAIREIFGYLPYWMLTSDYMPFLDYSLVSTLAYFSVSAQSNGTLAKLTSGGAVTTAGVAGIHRP